MWILRKYLVFLMLIALCLSCSDNKEEPQFVAKRTIVVYMIASNSMSGQDNADLAEMKNAIANYQNGDCRLLVYRVSYSQSPQLLEISVVDGNVATTTLKTYSNEQSQSVTKQRFSEVMADVKNFAPANDYGLVLWSHAAGWANSLPKSSIIRPRYFGIDNGATMSVDSLAEAIPAGMFTFIYADACYMSGIEVVYQLRKKTHYFIGSPAEMPYDGMPYDITLPLMFADDINYFGICDRVYEYYKNSSSGVTLSIVDCSKLDALATVCRNIHREAKELPYTSELQYYNRAQFTGVRIFYDFGQYTKAIMSDEKYSKAFASALDDAVIYKKATPSIFGITVNPDNYSGLSTSIYGRNSEDNDLLYSSLDWYNDVIK